MEGYELAGEATKKARAVGQSPHLCGQAEVLDKAAENGWEQFQR